MLFSKVFRRLLKEPTTVIGLVLLFCFFAIAIFAPLLSPYDPLFQNISGASLKPPSNDSLFGTDKLGRDIFSRLMYGGRISVFVGLAVVALAGSFGTLVGLYAGFRGGWADEALMRVTDIFFAFPSLILAMAIAGALGPSLTNALIAVAVVQWPAYACWCAVRCSSCVNGSLSKLPIRSVPRAAPSCCATCCPMYCRPCSSKPALTWGRRSSRWRVCPLSVLVPNRRRAEWGCDDLRRTQLYHDPMVAHRRARGRDSALCCLVQPGGGWVARYPGSTLAKVAQDIFLCYKMSITLHSLLLTCNRESI